jgi:hypothetical protein
MSRGPGRVERAIEAAFTACPDKAFTVEALIAIAFRGVNRIEKKHRVSVLRAARKVAVRLQWGIMWGGENGDSFTFYNPVDLHSYAAARFRSHAICLTEPRWKDELAQKIANLDVPGSKEWQYIQPGEAWFEFVEIERCRRAGDHARADELRARREAEYAPIARQGKLLGAQFSSRKRFSPDHHYVQSYEREIRGKMVRVRGHERCG